MTIRFSIIGLVLALAVSFQVFAQDSPDATLDALHQAGSDANSASFAALLTDNVVFLGMDGANRLEGPAVRNFVSDSFASGKAWSYRSSQRVIRVSDDGTVAWFDESLEHDALGRGRGTGVLLRKSGGWKVAQYDITIPLPNAVTPSSGAVTNPAPAEAQKTGTQEKPRCQMISHKTNTRAKC